LYTGPPGALSSDAKTGVTPSASIGITLPGEHNKTASARNMRHILFLKFFLNFFLIFVSMKPLLCLRRKKIFLFLHLD